MSDYEEIDIRSRQLLILEIAKKFDEICRKEGIWYSLTSGSILGAVRHKGFIPWDPDMDVVVKKSDMKRLRVALRHQLPDSMRLIEWDKEEQYPDGHDCISYVDINHYYVRFDIFTIVGTPKIYVNRWLFVRLCFYSYKLFYCKNKDTRYSKPNHVKAIELIKVLLKPIPDSAIVGWYELLESAYPLDQSQYYYVVQGGYCWRECLPKEVILDTMDAPFEDTMLKIPVQYDRYLTSLYGDYMIPMKDNYKYFN